MRDGNGGTDRRFKDISLRKRGLVMRKTVVLVGVLLLVAMPVFAADYVIGDGDVLNVSVWGVPELSGPATVRPDGKITLPAAGDVSASGLTPEHLAKNLTRVLGEFVKKPIVTVKVEKITNNKVYVAGSGVPSSVVQLEGRTTLFKCLCSLPSLENGDLRRAYLIRNEQKMKVDFHALLAEGDFSQDVELRPDDIVFIPSRELSKVYVLGAIKEPRFIFFRDGMKVLDAVLEAGGFNEYAKGNSVVVHRKSGQRLKVRGADLIEGKDLAQNIFLQPGDLITIEEGFF